MIATALEFDVQVIDGEIIPVPGVEVGARFSYPESPTTWSTATTDGDGWARFVDSHPEAPHSVCLYVGDEDCGTYGVSHGACIVLEM